MNLEKRVAHWVDLGRTDYQETFRFQQEMVELRKKNQVPDTILFAEHHPVIDFGRVPTHNKFSPDLIEQFRGNHEAIINHLNSSFNIGFSQTSRGGGATYIGPGQLMVYPIVHHPSITRSKYQTDLPGYNFRIDRIMHDTLLGLGVKDAQIVEVAEKLGEGDLRKDRKDVWVVRDGQNYKLGGKGTHFAGDIAYHGFNLYVAPESIAGFKHIQACGYTKEELDTTTISSEVGQVSIDQVRAQVLSAIGEHFNYSSILRVEPYRLAAPEVRN